ncbi:MAG: PAS domain S-box protein [Vicinamibacteraceae bacterium]
MPSYAMALLVVGVSLLVRLGLQPWLGLSVPYLQFFPAIMVSAWFGGFGPGAAATVASAAAGAFFFVPPQDSLRLERSEDVVSFFLFVATGFGIAWFNHRTRAAEAEARASVAAQRTTAAADAARAQELATILDTAVDGIIVIDAQGRIESVNRGAERLFGYTAAGVIGRNVSVLMPPPDHESHDKYLADFLKTGAASIIGIGRQVKGQRQDGTTFPLHLSVGEMTIGGERKFTGMLHDLSIRVEAEERRRSSDARWRAVVESAVDAMIVIDARGCIEAFNPAAERLFGWAEGEAVGQNVNVLMPSPYRDEHDGYLARYADTSRKNIIGVGREVRGLRRDGTTFPLHLSVGEMMIQGERKFTGILHDLTQRADVERQLREQTALARLGEMSAVVAHEVKNPLAGIRGAIQVIGGRLPIGKDREIVKEILGRIDALSELMSSLLVFARPPQPRLALVDLRQLVATTAALLAQDPTLRQVEVLIEGQASPTMADGSLLQIVFHNLLVNGAHAMQGQGTIRVFISEPASMCRVAVVDSGPGMSADVRDRIFEPFFTTKSRGSGLGLPTSKRLVEAHQGSLRVECPTEGGTTVVVELPISRRPASSADPS